MVTRGGDEFRGKLLLRWDECRDLISLSGNRRDHLRLELHQGSFSSFGLGRRVREPCCSLARGQYTEELDSAEH